MAGDWIPKSCSWVITSAMPNVIAWEESMRGPSIGRVIGLNSNCFSSPFPVTSA